MYFLTPCINHTAEMCLESPRGCIIPPVGPQHIRFSHYVQILASAAPSRSMWLNVNRAKPTRAHRSTYLHPPRKSRDVFAAILCIVRPGSIFKAPSPELAGVSDVTLPVLFQMMMDDRGRSDIWPTAAHAALGPLTRLLSGGLVNIFLH